MTTASGDGVLGTRTWYHTIDLPDGKSTPGFFDTRKAPRHVPWPDLAGKRCLDVGTFDGFWSFEMEKRGAAEVVSIDVKDPENLDWPFDSKTTGPGKIRQWKAERGTGFFEVAVALGSKAQWTDCSVYDLDADKHGQFDVILCGALLMHLRDPVRALERMRDVCCGCLLLVEAVDPVLEVRSRGYPAARLAVHFDEWWLANTAGLRAMVRKAGFQIEQVSKRFLVPFGEGRPEGVGTGIWTKIALMSPSAEGAVMRAIRAVPRLPDDVVASAP